MLSAPWSPPREFDYFHQISEVALKAGASVDDCGSIHIDGETPGEGMFHLLGHMFLCYDCGAYNDAHFIKLQRIVAYFIEIGFPVNSPNTVGETPFLSAAKAHSPYSTRYLQIILENGADPTAKDNWGRGALHLAIENHWEAVNNIIRDEEDSLRSNDDDSYYSDDSIDFNSSEEDQEVTRLERYQNMDSVGSKSQRLQFLRDKLIFLLRAGCDPGIKDNDGFMVCDYAERHNLSGSWHMALVTFDAT